jgi:hypothetical protein
MASGNKYALIRSVLEQEVLKREVLEGDKADEARKRIAKALKNKAEKNLMTKKSRVKQKLQKPLRLSRPHRLRQFSLQFNFHSTGWLVLAPWSGDHRYPALVLRSGEF